MRLLDRAWPLSTASSIVLSWAVYLVRVYPLLPASVGSNFGWSGRADAHQDKAGFLRTGLLVPLAMLALVVVLPLVLRKVPAEALNIPRRAFWLSAERIDQTFVTLTMYLDWFGVATIALLAAVLVLIVRANLSDGALASAAVITLVGLYLGFTVAWIGALYKVFK